jgi:dCTP deaminase
VTWLVDWQIIEAVKGGEIDVNPFDPDLVEPDSLDVRLGDTFRDPITKEVRPIYPVIGAGIEPGEFVLGTTLERFNLVPHVVGVLRGKSTIARHGLIVEVAGLVDGGFEGELTLEIFNMSRETLRVLPGMRIAQITFHRTAIPDRPYGHPSRRSKYQGQIGPTPAPNFEEVNDAD